MEVQTAESRRFSARSTLKYAGTTAAVIALLYLPALWWWSYARLLATLMLVVLLGLTGRTVLSALLAFRHPDRPSIPPDADLPEVSVVVPAYNEAAVLPETIEACRNLTYPAEKLEVVLCYEVDSADETAAICERAAEEDPRFKAVPRDEPGGGKAKATNYALRSATGDVIASIDADHQFEPSAIERAVAWFLDDPDVWCVKGRCFGSNPGDSLLALHATVERHIAEKADLFAREVFGGFTIFGGGQAFFRAELFEELGAFDETVLVEDVDMSSKIHAHGKRLRVDPGVVTFEENPATLQSWWSQRKRWARGWMQVACRYLTVLPRNSNLSLTAKVDAVYTFVYALAPALVAFIFPLVLLNNLTGVTLRTYLPYENYLWLSLAVAPAAIAYVIFAQDARDGLSHDWREFLAPATLWVYLGLQSVVHVTAFLDEFVFDRPSVYVTTARVESSAGSNEAGTESD